MRNCRRTKRRHGRRNSLLHTYIYVYTHPRTKQRKYGSNERESREPHNCIGVFGGSILKRPPVSHTLVSSPPLECGQDLGLASNKYKIAKTWDAPPISRLCCMALWGLDYNDHVLVPPLTLRKQAAMMRNASRKGHTALLAGNCANWGPQSYSCKNRILPTSTWECKRTPSLRWDLSLVSILTALWDPQQRI